MEQIENKDNDKNKNKDDNKTDNDSSVNTNTKSNQLDLKQLITKIDNRVKTKVNV